MYAAAADLPAVASAKADIRVCARAKAGELLRTYYAPGIGDTRVLGRLDPNEMDIDPGRALGPDETEVDKPVPDKKPKSPK